MCSRSKSRRARRSARACHSKTFSASTCPADSKLRLNFEALFHKYEGQIKTHTQNLLVKLNAGGRDIKAEVIDLFAAKLLNFVRNPFSIVKVLNSFPNFASYDPTDPARPADYRRIVSGKKPHQAHLCAQLGISDTQYVEWLRLLFMLLVPMAEGRPYLLRGDDQEFA